MDIELLKQELLRRLAPPSVRTPIGTIPSAIMAPLHYGALGPMAPEVTTATNTPQGLDTMRTILAIAMAGQAGQQGLQQLQSGMLQNRYNAGVESAYNRLPEGLFNPTQSSAIKSRLGDYVAGRMPELNPNIMPMFSGAGVPVKVGQPFNIRSIQLLSNLPQETMTPNQVLGFLSGKVKKSEIEGLGLKEFLEGKEKVSKQDLLAHIEQNTPRVEEIIKGSKKMSLKEARAMQRQWQEERERTGEITPIITDIEGFRERFRDETKFRQYQLPGATNYREVLIKAPAQKDVFDKSLNPKEKELQRLNGITYQRELTPEERQRHNELMSEVGVSMQAKWDKSYKEEQGFKSSHWDEPNPLFHRRVNERTSYKSPQKNDVLFGEEFQSDWAKSVRGLEQLKEKGVELQRPSHPLLKNWLELNLKGFIKDAIETGKRYISWTTGEQQAERYDLSKQIERITFNKHGSQGEKGGVYIAAFEEVDGGTPLNSDKTLFNREEAEKTFGKEISKKIFEGKETYGTLKGVDLKIGGEWAKNLYDKQIPNILRDLTGGHITEILMPTGTKDKNGSPIYLKQPALELTPEIKDEIKKKGFDLFSALPKYESESFANIKKQKEPKKIHYRV